MTATYSAERIFSRNDLRMVDYTPGVTTIIYATLDRVNTKRFLPLALFRRFAARILRTTGTGTTTGFSLYAATDSDGSGAVAIVSAAAASLTAHDAVGDEIGLECDADQAREVLSTATHIGVGMLHGTTTDHETVFFERTEPVYPATGLTADYATD